MRNGGLRCAGIELGRRCEGDPSGMALAYVPKRTNGKKRKRSGAGRTVTGEQASRPATAACGKKRRCPRRLARFLGAVVIAS